MPRYIRQKDFTSCGPVALINILKWFGCNVSYKDYIEIARGLCDHISGSDGGTEDKGMARALKAHKISFKKIKNPTLVQLDKHLDSGGIILLDYAVPCMSKLSPIPFEVGDWHFTLCIGRTNKTYIMVNDATKNTVGKRSRQTIQIMLKWDGNDHFAWMIKK